MTPERRSPVASDGQDGHQTRTLKTPTRLALGRGAKGGVGIDHPAESGATRPLSLSPERKETGFGLTRTGVQYTHRSPGHFLSVEAMPRADSL